MTGAGRTTCRRAVVFGAGKEADLLAAHTAVAATSSLMPAEI